MIEKSKNKYINANKIKMRNRRLQIKSFIIGYKYV